MMSSPGVFFWFLFGPLLVHNWFVFDASSQNKIFWTFELLSLENLQDF